MTLYSVPYLEHYADRFVQLRLSAHGLNLEQYLVAPQDMEALYGDLFLPLLPGQKLVQNHFDAIDAEVARLEAQVSHLPCRNGAVVEPLHHRRYRPRGTRSDFSRRARS